MKAVLLILLVPCFALAQSSLPTITSFPSLGIAAYSRGFGMGDAGIAGANENQQLGYNAAKTAFAQNFHQASFTYLPWMRSVSNDSRLIHADYLGTITNVSAIGFAINYLDLGNVAIRDNNGATIGLYRSNDFNIGTSYALQLGGNASLGVTMRFLGSRLFTTAIQNLYSFCGDVGYYQSINLGEVSRKLEWGIVVSNLGAKINLPSNVGVGISYTSMQDEAGNQLQVSLDANRLLSDDMRAVRISAGMEYGFADQFFVRGGVHLENQYDGNRKYFSFGAGYKGFVRDQSWGVDIHYLVPFGSVAAVSPFQNAYGMTLRLNVGNFQ